MLCNVLLQNFEGMVISFPVSIVIIFEKAIIFGSDVHALKGTTEMDETVGSSLT